jgi:hypothetical protein
MQPVTHDINKLNESTENRLEDATKKGDYEYWLTQEDIADIARLEYQNFRQGNEEDSFRAFEIIGSPQQLRTQLLSFKLRADHLNNARLTLIVNIGQQHWVTLLITGHNKYYEGFFIDSLGGSLPENYQRSLENISFVNLSGYFPGQVDDYNCGLWALENAQTLTLMADESKGSHWIIDQLVSSRNAGYFSERRRFFSSKLSQDPVRQQRLRPLRPPISVQETENLSSTSKTNDEPQAKKKN